MALIELKNVNKIYGKHETEIYALNEVNLRVNEGEFVAIMGKSGSGKSTLLNILGLITKPTNGYYYFEDNRIDELSKNEEAFFRNHKIGFVLQHFALVRSMKIKDNVALPLLYQKKSRKEIDRKVDEVLRRVGLEDRMNAYPYELSGGQNQRVAIARAIITNPKLILADEPTGALDQKTGNEIIGLFEKLNKEGTTIIVVTHDRDVANRCEKIYYMQDGKLNNKE